MVVSFRCAGPRPKMPVERARFAFLGQSAAERRMTAEDELEQPSGSGRSIIIIIIMFVYSIDGITHNQHPPRTTEGLSSAKLLPHTAQSD